MTPYRKTPEPAGPPVFCKDCIWHIKTRTYGFERGVEEVYKHVCGVRSPLHPVYGTPTKEGAEHCHTKNAKLDCPDFCQRPKRRWWEFWGRHKDREAERW